ncbi:MAG: chromosome segregation protein SMC [Proteobacteria bacterium]|nr:MAG: chromosome segregation protein SMC [Pseudomonadota bacterium]
MRLKKIKLAGFKSFVDPTTIPLHSNLTGIVGPNGCGKSNVIDAVRWVMGESSAKNLRGDSMADVIFNGSNSRKPVGQAFIELVFDNSDGSLGGQYANYAEISIKRVVARDGQSNYFLNSARCRRRDITDVFLGTGLGPRSYSIIEQGMISRLIEAKPEELRIYLEEAAGISKYKERRRETETRMRHTRENLERLQDLRDEVAKQLQHLQRQAKTAERFKVLKEEERRLKAEYLALRWRGLDHEDKALEQKIRELETRREAALAEQRGLERQLEEGRAQQIETNDGFNEVQGRYYGVGAEIARVEQAIQHGKETEHRQQHDLQQVEKAWQEAQSHIHNDQHRLGELTAQLREHEPQLGSAEKRAAESAALLASAEEGMRTWQAEWDEFNRLAAEPAQTAEVERTRIQHLDQQLMRLRDAIKRNEQELQSLSWEGLEREIGELETQMAEHTTQGSDLEAQLGGLSERIGELREHNTRYGQEIHQARIELQNARGRDASIEALQQAALGEGKGVIAGWLERQGLKDAPRLAKELQVENGWERAVETVLGASVEAVCVEGLDAYADVLSSIAGGTLTLLERNNSGASSSIADATPLASKVSADWSLGGLLQDIYAADDLNAALRLREHLPATGSVVTRDGLWVGRHWLRVVRESDAKAGVLEREKERRELSVQIDVLERRVSGLELELENTREELREEERRRDELQSQLNRLNSAKADIQAQVAGKRGRLEQARNRSERLTRELREAEEQIDRDESHVREARGCLDGAVTRMDEFQRRRETLVEKRREHETLLEQRRALARNDRDQVHQVALRVESTRTGLASTQQSLERMRGQIAHLATRREELQEGLRQAAAPSRALATELEALLKRRIAVEEELGRARRKVEEIDERLRGLEQGRSAAEQKVQEVREALDRQRMEWQGVHVRRQTVEEQIIETGFALQALFEEMPESATTDEWHEKVENIAQRIQRLGPINLAAIDEFKEQSERMAYLDSQYADLTESLNTLENAIRKIDRETRTRFKETYDKVNSGLKEMFPRLYGGGHAYLEMTGNDLLDTGITVMARPPGKRISTIHLLSGGEKALTAVALVFAIFQLNPAPFCMLDEVDAPLDEANVGRFCDLVREMSERVQFIFITHNKTTMEMANQLIGVTMHEPGVSRLVAVDVDDAVQMATG